MWLGSAMRGINAGVNITEKVRERKSEGEREREKSRGQINSIPNHTKGSTPRPR